MIPYNTTINNQLFLRVELSQRIPLFLKVVYKKGVLMKFGKFKIKVEVINLLVAGTIIIIYMLVNRG